MKKIVSNVLIVSTQLIIGALFLIMLFSDNSGDNKIVVVDNDNLNKMADAVSELFVEDKTENSIPLVVSDDTKVVDLIAEEEKAKEEARIKAEEAARIKAEEEAKAKAEEEARIKAEEEAKAKAQAEEAARNAVTVSANGYNSKPAAGFNVTTGNKTYQLSDSDFAIVATVVNCEANRSSRDDILAVMSVILNRADRNGSSPVAVVSAPHQFSCYTGRGTNVSDFVSSVMRDALNGIRNTKYTSFNSWYSSVSNNYIVNGGNRYY